MSTTYGNKRLVVGAHYGWRDFLVQRISGAVQAVMGRHNRALIGFETQRPQKIRALEIAFRGARRHLAGNHHKTT